MTQHPTAIIHPSAQLAADVEIGPYAVVEHDTVIGAGTTIGAAAYIGPWTTLGRNNRIYHHASVGSDSQALAYRVGDETYLTLGDDNIVREYATINRASDPGGTTVVGDGCCFMANSHVAHNSLIGNGVVFANSAAIGGHVTVQDHAILGGLVGVHQFCRVGRHAIIGSNTKVNMDVVPYVTVDGHPARPHGINVIGLRRHQLTEDTIRDIREAYKILFRRGNSLRDALDELHARFHQSPEIAVILDFIGESVRGVLRPRKGFALR